MGSHLDTFLCMTTHKHTHFSFDFQSQCQFEGQAFWHVLLCQLVKFSSMSATIYCSTEQRIWLFVSTILRALHLIRHQSVLVKLFVCTVCVCVLYIHSKIPEYFPVKVLSLSDMLRSFLRLKCIAERGSTRPV